MGGVPVKHHSKSKVGKRRSQQRLKKPVFFVCPYCGGPVLPHRLCPQCHRYQKIKASFLKRSA